MGKTYRHYRRKTTYEVLHEGLDVKTKEEVVIYKGLSENPPYPVGQVWVRKKDTFYGEVEVNGEIVKRFQLLD